MTATLSKPRTLRFQLASLVLVSVVPLLMFAIIMAALLEKQQRASLEGGFRDTARALTVAVDHELASSISALQALATSEHLNTGDLRLFYRAAQRVMVTHPGWITINLTDPSGRQLINVYRPFGAPLPAVGHLEDVRHTLDTGEPAISNLFTGLVLKVPTVGFTVPVRRRGMLKYVLGARLDVKQLSLLLSEGKLPPSWVATIIDRNGIIIARTRGIEALLGKSESPEFVAQSRQFDEGSFRDVTRDGTPVYAAHRRSRSSGWTVGIEVPVAVVEAPGRTSRWAIIAGGSLLLLLAGAFATVFGRRITGGMESLSISARALGQGHIPSPIEISTIVEIAAVERDLVEAARQRTDAIAARLKSEEALRESEERTRLIVSHALDAVITIDAQGQITSWNPQAERLFGWSEEEIRGRLLSDTIIPSAYREAHERGLRHFVATGDGPVLNRRIELSALHRSGTEFSVELAITPLRVGGAIAFSAFLRDITEQKRTEKALRDSEASFRLLFADNPLPMWVYDLATMSFLEVNDAAVAHYGYTREEFLRMRISDIRPPEDVAQLTELVTSLAARAGPGVRRHEGRWRHRLKDGRVRDVDIVSHALTFAGRAASLVVAIDVTEVKQSQEALTNYAERLSILHEIDRAIVTARPPAEIAEIVLRRLRPLLGVPRAIVNLFDLQTGEVEWLAAAGRRRTHAGPGIRYSLQLMGDVEALKRGEVQVVDVDALPPSAETQALRGSGVSVYMVVPMIAGGELIGGLSFGGATATFPPEQVSIASEVAAQMAIAIAQARLSERVTRQALELELRVQERTRELEAANQELDAFSYSISHDLRAPLRAMQGFTEALLEDYSERLDTTGQDYAQRIVAASHRMDALIQDLLAYSRLSRTEVRLDAVDVETVVDEACGQMATELKDRGGTITVDRPLARVMAHRTVFGQVLTNLLTNAVKFVAPDTPPRVRIWTERREEWVRLSVEDNGIGIIAEHQDRIFRAFERLHGVEQYPGTGIGLAIVQKGIARLGGQVGVESTLGQGSRFWVELKRAEA